MKFLSWFLHLLPLVSQRVWKHEQNKISLHPSFATAFATGGVGKYFYVNPTTRSLLIDRIFLGSRLLFGTT